MELFSDEARLPAFHAPSSSSIGQERPLHLPDFPEHPPMAPGTLAKQFSNSINQAPMARKMVSKKGNSGKNTATSRVDWK